MLVVFGGASGPVEGLAVERLNSAGSVFLTRPTLGYYTRSREEVRERAGDLFAWLGDGRLNVRIDSRYPLAEAAEAHAALSPARRRASCCCSCEQSGGDARTSVDAM